MSYVNTKPLTDDGSTCDLRRHPATPQYRDARSFVERYAWFADREAAITEHKRAVRGAGLWPEFTAKEVN